MAICNGISNRLNFTGIRKKNELKWIPGPSNPAEVYEHLMDVQERGDTHKLLQLHSKTHT